MQNFQDEYLFWEFGVKCFEYFVCVFYVMEFGIVVIYFYVFDGQEQFGVDYIVVYVVEDECYFEIGQVKVECWFGLVEICVVVDKFFGYWEVEWSDKNVCCFIFFVGCMIKSCQVGDEIIVQIEWFVQFGVVFLVWDVNEIYDYLLGVNVVVCNYFGQDWYEWIFGKLVGLFVGFIQDIECGDFGVFYVQSFVMWFNQVEVVEIVELKW